MDQQELLDTLSELLDEKLQPIVQRLTALEHKIEKINHRTAFLVEHCNLLDHTDG